MNNNYFHPDSDYFRKVLDAPPPVATPHATEEEIWANMKQLKPNKWVLRGNQLEGETEMGKLVQFIPTDYILVSTDAQGLPVFRKVVY